MPNPDISRKLTGAEERLAVVTDALLTLNAPASQWATTLSQAAELLQNIRPAEIARAEWASAQQRLSRLAAQAGTARTLLDSAASLYFGRVLSQGSVDCGYQADGAADTFGGGCFRIHG